MKYLYGWSWHEQLREPVDEIDEAAARKAWEDGPQLSVSAGPDLVAGVVPDYTLVMNAHGEDVAVHRYTKDGSIEAILDWGVEGDEGRLFLGEVTEYLYPDDGAYHSQRQSLAVRSYVFRPDGYARLRSSVEAMGADTVEEFSGVDVSDHWLDPLTWGDWDRIGTCQPSATGPAG